MGFLKNLFAKKELAIESYQDFWNWFASNEKKFFQTINQNNNVEKNFFNKLSPKLEQIKGDIFFLTGMFDDNTAELILSAEGEPKNIVFVEELVSAAPYLKGWRFTALKPAMDNDKLSIEMSGYTFSGDNLSFYSNEIEGCPDEIDITIVHKDFSEENKNKIINGTYIFLDNYLGELEFVETIDELSFCTKEEASQDLIPLVKLKDFIRWRQKEFIEKYEGVRYDTENDNYTVFESKMPEGSPLVATMNAELLHWDSKASHPWILKIEMPYDGKASNGMPNRNVSELMNTIEEDILEDLKDVDGYLNIGRETGLNKREIFLACKDYRKPSKLMYQIQKKHTKSLEITYSIFKDKYWQSVGRFVH